MLDKKIIGLSTIEEIIEYGNNLNINHEKLFLKGKTPEGIIFNTKFILDEYMDFIEPYITEITMSDNELIKYKFRPKTLCFDLYGNGELAYAILRLNHMSSAMEFTKKQIKIFKSNINDFINEVLSLEAGSIARNNKMIGK